RRGNFGGHKPPAGSHVTQRSRSFARWNQSLRQQPQLQPALLRLSAQNACQKVNERISTMPFLLSHFSPGDKIEKAKSGYASFNRFRLCRFTFFHARQRDTLAPQLIGHATVSNRFSANSACVRCSSAASRS